MTNQLTVEIIPVAAETLIQQGILLPSSPLLRGEPAPSHILQVVKRRPDGSLYELSYRQPLPGDITKSSE